MLPFAGLNASDVFVSDCPSPWNTGTRRRAAARDLLGANVVLWKAQAMMVGSASAARHDRGKAEQRDRAAGSRGVGRANDGRWEEKRQKPEGGGGSRVGNQTGEEDWEGGGAENPGWRGIAVRQAGSTGQRGSNVQVVDGSVCFTNARG